uniref:Cytochrome c oxidase subunit 3 n=1 Tax=Trichuris discolor TaxID=483153 RepID=J7FC16_9BILA|nr:cytochrome c oxidase subunit III [Trichuris discolor]AFK81042.1 cytochrome c oxidase subunit 3 [Trichuris discolor]
MKLLIYDAPWAPLFCILALNVILCLVSFMKMITMGHPTTPFMLPLALCLLLLTSIFWNRDCTRESTLGVINDNKCYNIKMGMLLFLLSEAFFFLSFFWMFISSVLAPELSFWPPSNLKLPSFIGAPSLNTILLVASSATVTLSHYEKDSKSYISLSWLILTLILSFLFLTVQYIEYLSLPFNFTSGVGGSIFFMATGFHGSHVILGSMLLLGCSYLMYKNFFTENSMLSYELAIWYWHFVDAIWLMLYTIFYCWGH